MLEGIYVLNIKLELLSGLYIGGNDSGFDIGGADSDVIRNPLTNEPYIPGSSLKGKLKSLLKYHVKEVDIIEKDIVFKDSNITNIFKPIDEGNIKITRAIFRDLTLTKESEKELQNILGTGCFTEIKAENKVNPISGKSDSPRFIERVPAGAIFEGEIVLNVFDGDNKEIMMDNIKKSLKLLEMNYLGGNGTRGYGRVKVEFDEFKEVNL
ncbi:type III-A CRISPR-associated RAMP protein Csm3 [Thomasclavelia spiroformis]|uniref:CRISPR system Cms endoribonuclease Csm3 n=1 Tax=Thomasclavelia spiroformis TaxID=29348 RepID=A0A921GDP5_9FIRM|nr:type III-A CRISPR-associated RAMP protein Csm3 [Thomasclavelia spiroformis]MBS6684836.1 type III-A CRISPR-associated RAMP protein Csm3 [Thomasclavelia spiroformis]HJF41385.1 type III-A CRISPR-associated RAMP protein Csm3 [Thomasclavelia spiroformis]